MELEEGFFFFFSCSSCLRYLFDYAERDAPLVRLPPKNQGLAKQPLCPARSLEKVGYFMDNIGNKRGGSEKQTTTLQRSQPVRKMRYPVKSNVGTRSHRKDSGKSKTVNQIQGIRRPVFGIPYEGVVDGSFEGGLTLTLNVNGINMKGYVFMGTDASAPKQEP